MTKLKEIASLIAAAEQELTELDAQRATLQGKITELKQQRTFLAEQNSPDIFQQNQSPQTTNHSSEKEKIALFRSLFTGRVDVFAKRFESLKTGKSGYQPCCRNEWAPGICRKPKGKCSDCDNRDFVPIDDTVTRGHLLGSEPHKQSSRDFTIGLYPMLEDESCRFLAVDFDRESWTQDVAAFMETCNKHSVPVALERSRSGLHKIMVGFLLLPLSF